MSQAIFLAPGNFPSGFVQTLTGDNNIAVPPTAGNINVITNVAMINCGSSIEFIGVAATSTLTLYVTDSNNNTVIGKDAGNSSTVGAAACTGLGYNALNALIGGHTNTAIGFNSLDAAVSPLATTAIGAESLTSLTSGDYNVAVGAAALGQLVTGAQNIAIGETAGAEYTGAESNNILLGSLGVLGESNVMRLGYDGANSVNTTATVIYGITGVTVSNPQTVVIDSATGQLGVGTPAGAPVQTLKGDSGAAVTPTAGNINVITDVAAINSGSSIAFAGSGSTLTLNTTDQYHNVLIGEDAGNATLTGSFNVGLGQYALQAVTVSGGSGGYDASYNNCIGYASGQDITTAAFNQGFGYYTLQQLLTGRNNICLGSQAGMNYTGAETGNIILGSTGSAFDLTVPGENNTLRIGFTTSSSVGGLTAAYICGIDGVALTTANIVTEVSNQLGSATLVAGTNVSIDASSTPNQIIISANATEVTENYTAVSTSPYVVLPADYYLGVDSSGGAIQINLPNAPVTGRAFVVKDSTGSARTNNITITTVGGLVDIDGGTAFALNTNYQAVSLIFNSVSYEIY